MNNVQFDPTKPLYEQIKDRIKEQILAGKFEEGQKIPSERELCQKFGVSRITVRQAIQAAIHEGLLFTVQGKGTFVLNSENSKMNQGLSKITSFKKTIASSGLTAGTKILDHQIRYPDFALSKILDIEITTPVLVLNLLGTADGKPIVYYESCFQAKIGERFYRKAEAKQKKHEAFSTYDFYKDFTDLMPAYAEQTFESVAADEYIAGVLNIPEGSPLFLVTSIIFSTSIQKPVEYKKAYYRSDKYRFHVKRRL